MAKDQSWIADLLAGYKKIAINGTTVNRRNILNFLTGAGVDNPNFVDPDTGQVVGSTDVTISGSGTGLIPFLFATLRSTSPQGARDVKVIDGYNAQGDGGKGVFVWNNASTATDDSGTIAKVTGVTTGRWVRQYLGGIDPKWFGAQADGTTDDTSAMVLCDEAATALSTHIKLTAGTYKATTTISSTLDFQPGSLLLGAITLNGGILAGNTQHIFAAGSVITLSSGAPSPELWAHWWGATGNEGTDDTAALQAALLSFQGAAQNRFGSTLNLAAGGYIVSSPLVLTNCSLGGTIRGQGIQSTFIFGTGALAGKTVFTLYNCVQVRVERLAVQTSAGASTTLASPAAAGATTLALNGTIPGLANGMSLIVSRAGVIGSGLCGYEHTTVTAGATTTTLTVPALAGSYTTGDTVYFPTEAAIGVHEDSVAVGGGESSTNRFEEVFAGRSDSFPTCAHPIKVDYNLAGADVNNPSHYFGNCIFAGGAESAALIYGNNAENLTFTNCLFEGAWGIKTQNAASFSLINPGFEVTKGNILLSSLGAGSSQQEDKITVFGGYSEGSGQVLVGGGAGYSLMDIGLFGFSQKGLTQTTVVNTVTATTSTLTISGGSGGSGFYPGQAVDIWSFDGTVHETGVIDHVSGSTQLTLTAGLANTYTKGSNAYAAIVTTRTVDVSSTNLSVALSNCFLSYGGYSGVLMHFQDASENGNVVLDGCRSCAFGYIADGVAFQDRGSFWQTSPDNLRKVTLLNGATETVIGQTGGIGGPAWKAGSWRGLSNLYTGRALGAKSIDAADEVQIYYGTVRIAFADSPFTAQPNTKVVVDCSGGNVVVEYAAPLTVGQLTWVQQDSSTALSGHTITVTGNSQTLETPGSPGTFASTAVISTLGETCEWVNDNSGSGKLLLTDWSGTASGVASVSAGTGITVTGTSTVPIINNGGVLSITSGNGTIGGTSQNPVIDYPVAQTAVFTTAGTYTWTNPFSYNIDVWVSMCGGGGQGGGGQSKSGDVGGNGGGGGGGSEWKAVFVKNVTPGAHTVVVGAGGVSGGGAGASGAAGAASTALGVLGYGASGGGSCLTADASAVAFGGASHTAPGINVFSDSRVSTTGNDVSNFPGPKVAQGGNGGTGGSTTGTGGYVGQNGAISIGGSFAGGAGGAGSGQYGGGGGGGQGPFGSGGAGGVNGVASGNASQGTGPGAGGGGGAGGVTGGVGAQGQDGCVIVRWIG